MSAARVRTAVVIGFVSAVVLGCDDDTVTANRDAATQLSVNPSFTTVDAADTVLIRAAAQNRAGESTFDAIEFAACDNQIVAVADPDQTTIEPPRRILVIGQTLGVSCLEVTSGGLVDTATVTVVPAELVVIAAPETLRAGFGGEVVVEARDAAGNPVSPFVRADADYFSSNSAIVAIVDDTGRVTTQQSGVATVTVTWTGTGVTSRSVTHDITVIADTPTTATLADPLPAVDVDSVAEVEVILEDALGNQNTVPFDIIDATVTSSDPLVASASVRLDSTLVEGSVIAVSVIVTITGEASGQADISGTVETSGGTLAFGPSLSNVVNPTIVGIVPNSGPTGTQVTISGTDLARAGLETSVTVGGESATEFIDSATPSQIILHMPNAGNAGTFDVVVALDVALSPPVPWTQMGQQDPEDPADDDPATATAILIPFNGVSSFVAGDIDDWYSFSLAAPATLTITLDWNTGKDLDFLVFDSNFDPADGSFDGVGCEGFFDHPEVGTCSLPAGDYFLLVEDFTAAATGDFAVVTYELTITP